MWRKTPQLTEAAVLAALDAVQDPERGGGLVALGMIQGLHLKDGAVAFAIEVAPERGPKLEDLRRAAEKAVLALPGVRSVSAVLTAERAPQPQAAAQPTKASSSLLPQVKAIVAVASGKGGVGKSTTAANLTLALAGLGLKVGMLDADVYGPSLPRMLGVSGQPEMIDGPNGRQLKPQTAYGVECMSMGFLAPEDAPMIWRGPMVMGALEQMMRDVAWSALDVLIVDMPPGTGDAQLTMAQKVPLAGAVIVSTPQDIALLDARRGLQMFHKVNVPVLGIIENMSYFLCPNCGHRSEIFSHGGARAEALKLGCDFLGEIPLDPSIRIAADDGKPIVLAAPDGVHAASYRAIAQALADKLADRLQGAAPAGPTIRFS